MSIVGVLCPEPSFRAEVFIFPRVLGVLAAVTPESLSSYCPWHKRVVLPKGKPLP